MVTIIAKIPDVILIIPQIFGKEKVLPSEMDYY